MLVILMLLKMARMHKRLRSFPEEGRGQRRHLVAVTERGINEVLDIDFCLEGNGVG